MVNRLLVAMMIGALLFINAREDAPVIPFDDTLETGLRDDYGEYVHALNNAAQGDTVSIERVLRTDGLYDGAAYEHGWVLLELLRIVGDARYHDALVKLDTVALKRACTYMEGGLDVHTKSQELRRQYPRTFQTVKRFGVLGTVDIPSEREVDHDVEWSDGRVSVWIEKGYRDCLLSSLPCACTDYASAILIVVDTADHMETIIDASEYATYHVHSWVQGHVYHLRRDGDTAGEYEQWYSGDTLYSRDENGTRVFLRINTPSGDYEHGRLLEQVNASYLGAMLSNRGFNPDAFSGMQIVGLRCNNDLGVNNQLMMRTPAECPRIMEDQGRALVVYEMLGDCAVKSIPSRIRWREILRVAK